MRNPRQTMLYTRPAWPHEKIRIFYMYDEDEQAMLYLPKGSVASHVYELSGDMGHWGP